MTHDPDQAPIRTAFVTGATGLLGNNLVRALLVQGVKVKALARSREKALMQFGALDGLEIVVGDMTAVSNFAPAFRDVDVVFHVAAHFRDFYKGGGHWAQLKAVNVDGTRDLIAAAYAAGIRRMVHTSSIAVLDGPAGALVNETMTRKIKNADDYYRSKILADEEVLKFLGAHPDMHASMVLPGWMHGPGDFGPTAAGQVTLDFVAGKIPGIVPGSFSFVDARDVALAQIVAASRGQRGERYLAAGRHMTMAELLVIYEQVTGVAAPKRKIPGPALLALATVSELQARITKKPALLSLATVKLMRREADRSHFDHAKSERELGLRFRPVAETLADQVAFYRDRDWLKTASARAA